MDWFGSPAADRGLAVVAINDAVAAAGDQIAIANAKSEFAKGDRDLVTTKPARSESAIDHYREAWRHALKAVAKG